MKKSIIVLFLMAAAFLLQGCTPSEKTFSKAGVTITLNESFVQKDVIQAPLYLESTNHIFMAVRESKQELASYGIDSLAEYIDAVLTNSGKNVQTFSKTEGEVTYLYAYYTATVNDQEFGYMLLAFEGANHYYSMNFGCLESNLEKSKDQYFDWAKTITVE